LGGLETFGRETTLGLDVREKRVLTSGHQKSRSARCDHWSRRDPSGRVAVDRIAFAVFSAMAKRAIEYRLVMKL